MKNTWLLCTLISIVGLNAHAEMPPICTNEIDVLAKPKATAFSDSEWVTVYNQLMKSQPTEPSGPQFLSAAAVYYNYLEQSKSFKKMRDKKQHCFMGCVIAENINYPTAAYMAWYKEWQDLTDCDPKTFFEYKDLAATLKGAAHGQDCYDWCDTNITKKDR